MQAILRKGRTWSADAFNHLSLSTSGARRRQQEQQQVQQGHRQQEQARQPPAEAMEGLVLRSLAKIRKLVGSSSRKHKALRDACDTVIGAWVHCVG